MASKKYSIWKSGFDDFCTNLGLEVIPVIETFHGKRIEEELIKGENPDIYWEMRILSEKDKFAVYRDAEGVYRDCAFYKDLMISMNNLSSGKFSFKDIREYWFWEDEDEIFIKLEFTANGNKQQIWIKRTSDFARPEFIELINIVLGLGEGKRFELTGYPNEWVVVYVNSDQKKLMQQRGWDFQSMNYEFDDAIFWQAQQNSKYDYFDSLLFFLEKEEFQVFVNKNPWLLYYRGLTHYKLDDENNAWCDWSVAMNSQDKEILDLIRRFSEK